MNHRIAETLLRSAAKRYPRKLKEKERNFIADYYHRLPEDDFSPAATQELVDAALKHRDFGDIRKPGETLVEIFNIDSSLTDPEPCTVVNVVSNDRPFLVDTLTILVNALNSTIHRTIHPVFQVRRSKANRITEISRSHFDTDGQEETAESFIQFHIDYVPSASHKQLRKDLFDAVDEVKTAVADWSPVREHLLSLAVELENNRSVDVEYSRLLRWLENHHFAMLGYCECNLSGSMDDPVVRVDRPTALGFLRVLGKKSSHQIRDFLPPLGIAAEKTVVITKTRQRSSIHRAAFMDCILVSRPRARGKGRRVYCVLGLFSAAAFVRPTLEIPLLREKTAWVLQQSTLRKGSYAYKSLQMIVENLPRESLFHMDGEEIYQLSMDILNHQERRKTNVYIHQDQCGHFYSCLIFVPRDLYHSDLRLKIEAYLQDVLEASEVLFDVFFSDSILTRIHFILHTRSGRPVSHDSRKIAHAIQAMSRDWNDSLRLALAECYDLRYARKLMPAYTDAFSEGYRDDFVVADAVADIEHTEACNGEQINTMLYHSQRDGRQTTRLKVYSPGKPIPLSDILPIMENLGLRVLGERPYRLRRKHTEDAWVHDFEIVREDGKALDIPAHGNHLRKALHRVWRGDAENDGFNQLVLDTQLSWRRVVVLRACFRYLRQIRLRYSQEYVVNALKANRNIVDALASLFEQRFRPGLSSYDTSAQEEHIASLLEQVESLDEDRILRAMRDVILAMLRTNYYQLDDDGKRKEHLSFKIDSRVLPRMPEPRPKYEIFVYSPRVEGIHLRGGDVARGGLRWSDRLEDYRTEVLGLVKAQMVKNAVIVPVGSKGGFVPRRLPDGNRDEIQREVISCYRTFVTSLLGITDNLVAGEVAVPPLTVRHDGDDPYLVVAADKGTATFSDIANEISESKQFWLGDAFASGGSMGYDHKKMGITARGAWESVKRLFRERGKNIQNSDFTVAGIGDMGGDVFGNGMLLSPHIRLQAAFNHMHIFIDPDPDPVASFAERKRLFEMPRSSWADYQSNLISRGGGIFERRAKSIKLSAAMQAMLDTELVKCSPTELIQLILKMPVELLWNGGIGTYVKASHETHEDAQDKANDALRVDATELRCAVIGEGGNLGVTQFGRIEFAQLGGLCNTDAIDNSAGVDTSDHEVNIKILFNRAMEEGAISLKQRNKLLTGMETELAELVLRNNYSQNQTISVARHFGDRLMHWHSNAIRFLEQHGLNRKLEYLPDDQQLQERLEKGESLTRPELAVLLSYSKMDIYDALLDSELPDDDAMSGEIEAYFPSAMRKRFKPFIHRHRLKREIIATQLTNRFVGQLGLSFHISLNALMGVGAAEVLRAWFVAQEIMQSNQLIEQIEALDNQVEAGVQLEALQRLSDMLKKTIIWLLKHHPGELDIQGAIAQYSRPVKSVKTRLDSFLCAQHSEELAVRNAQFEKMGFPDQLATEMASLGYYSAALEIAGISITSGKRVDLAAACYFRIYDALGLGWMEQAIEQLHAQNEWHERARLSLRTDLSTNHAAISCQVLNSAGRKPAEQRVENWMSARRVDVENIEQTVSQLKALENPDFPMLSVLMSSLSSLS